MLGGLGIFFQFELQRKFSNNIRAPQLHKNLPAFSRGIYQEMHHMDNYSPAISHYLDWHQSLGELNQYN